MTSVFDDWNHSASNFMKEASATAQNLDIYIQMAQLDDIKIKSKEIFGRFLKIS